MNTMKWFVIALSIMGILSASENNLIKLPDASITKSRCNIKYKASISSNIFDRLSNQEYTLTDILNIVNESIGLELLKTHVENLNTLSSAVYLEGLTHACSTAFKFNRTLIVSALLEDYPTILSTLQQNGTINQLLFPENFTQ